MDELNIMYVDHLTTNLEKRNIAEILNFLAKYCGWKRIISYAMDQFLNGNDHPFVNYNLK